MRAAGLVIVLAAGATVLAGRPIVTSDAGALAPGVSAGATSSGVAAGERQALLDLYNGTGGAAWTHNAGWSGAAGTECSWYGVTCDAGGTSVQGLDLHYNNLVGTIPGSLGGLTKLQRLSLDSNKLGGPIPAQLGGLGSLTDIGLSNNQLTGSIPAQLGSLAALQRLYFGANQLSGSIPPALGSLAALLVLDISLNQLTGTVPGEIGGLASLQYLGLRGNMLSGALPGSLKNLSKLVAGQCDLRYNALFSTDAALTAFLTGRQAGGDWQSTQTVAPGNVSAGEATGTTVTLTWAPIAYTADTGGYRAYHSTTSGGPYLADGITATKSAASIVVNGLSAKTTYYFVVRTVTNPHADVENRNTVTSDPSAEVHATTTPSYPSVLWVPVASHNGGLNQSQWRSDLGLLNPSGVTSEVLLKFFASGGVVSNTTYVPGGAQAILTDVVGQLPASGSGALEVLSEQPLRVTARSYNQVSPGASCYPNGTQGQDYPAVAAGAGLSAGESAYLPGLTENAADHCNIGLVNTGTTSATVLVELCDGGGNLLASYTASPAAGQWLQETQPFKNKANRSAMDCGYARVTVESGSGVHAFASVIDNVTNDPTTVAMQRAPAPVAQRGGKLVGTGAAGGSSLGYSVAISADGDTALVGGLGDNANTGAAWVFTRSGDGWSQQGSKLIGSAAVGAAYQGSAVAVSADGSTAIVGGYRDDSNAGAAWVFTRSGGTWSQQGAKLVGSGAAGTAYQGISAAISADGNTAIVGGDRDNNNAGAAWVFTRSGGTWSQQGGKLVGSGAVGTAYQGISVAISADGNTALVGGLADNANVGAAWVFTRSGGVWSQQGGKLVGSGAVGTSDQGYSVALSADGGTAIIGGILDDSHAGAAWVFTRSGGVWSQTGAKLTARGAVGGAQLGMSVALSADGGTAVVGGDYDNGNAGAAWVFTRGPGGWSQAGGKLVGGGAVGAAWQGRSAAIAADGRTVVIGGSHDDSSVGAAWVYSAATEVWVPVASHNGGLNQSQWRSNLGLLNTGVGTANARIAFYGSGGETAKACAVPAGGQALLVDVVGQLGANGSGALEIDSDRPVLVTARSYNQVSPVAGCYPNGKQGQDYPALGVLDGLSASRSAWLPHLTENASYHTNIGLVNCGATAAAVTVELYNGAGALLATYGVSLGPGEWKQETQPFLHKAQQAAMDRGYARITVQTGSGVAAFASVISNVTNDPTTIAMQP